MSKLAQYTEKSGIPLNWEKMVVMKGKKLKGNKVWSANKGEVVCREYKYSNKILLTFSLYKKI